MRGSANSKRIPRAKALCFLCFRFFNLHQSCEQHRQRCWSAPSCLPSRKMCCHNTRIMTPVRYLPEYLDSNTETIPRHTPTTLGVQSPTKEVYGVVDYLLHFVHYCSMQANYPGLKLQFEVTDLVHYVL